MPHRERLLGPVCQDGASTGFCAVLYYDFFFFVIVFGRKFVRFLANKRSIHIGGI